MTASALRSLVLILTAALASPVAAQVCNGAASFSNGLVRIGLGAGSTGTGFGSGEGTSSVGVQLGIGAARGPFGTFTRSVLIWSTAAENRFVSQGLASGRGDDAVGLVATYTAGYSLTMPGTTDVELCPIAGYSSQNLNLREGSGNANAAWLGLNVGKTARVWSALTLLPFAGLSFAQSDLTVNRPNSRESITDNYFGLTGGVGIVFMRVTIRPNYSIPVGLEGGHDILGFDFAFNIGPRRL